MDKSDEMFRKYSILKQFCPDNELLDYFTDADDCLSPVKQLYHKFQERFGKDFKDSSSYSYCIDHAVFMLINYEKALDKELLKIDREIIKKGGILDRNG